MPLWITSLLRFADGKTKVKIATWLVSKASPSNIHVAKYITNWKLTHRVVYKERRMSMRESSREPRLIVGAYSIRDNPVGILVMIRCTCVICHWNHGNV